MNNLLSYYGLVEVRIRASEKDLIVCNQPTFAKIHSKFEVADNKSILKVNEFQNGFSFIFGEKL